MPKVQNSDPYYAVARGRVPGIYRNWEDCQEQVLNFSASKHKKFRNGDAARDWLRENGVTLPESDNNSRSSGPSPSRTRVAVHETRTTNIAERTQPDVKGKSKVIPISGNKTKVLDQAVQTTNTKVTSAPVERYVVFCDGASRGNGTPNAIAGVGVYWGHGDSRNIAERCPGHQTNNRAELIAIVRVLETTPIDGSPLIIKTDSQYSIKCMTEWLPKWRRNAFRGSTGKPVANKGIICYIDALLDERKQAGQSVQFEHVRGHAGIEGNEGADRQANLGCELPAVPEQDWDILEAETRARIEDAQVDMKVVEEVVAEAENSASASASAPIGTTAGTETLDVAMEVEVEQRPIATTQDDGRAGAATAVSSTPKSSKKKASSSQKSPFKPANPNTPQFTSPVATSSRLHNPGPTSTTPQPAQTASTNTSIIPEMSPDELNALADCLGSADELEAEIAD